MESINDLLANFLQLNGVTGAAIIGRDGFVIESSMENETNIDALGAMVATSFVAAEELSAEFNLGSLDNYLSEFSEGKVFMISVNDDILAIFTESNAVIGSIRYATKKSLPNIISSL